MKRSRPFGVLGALAVLPLVALAVGGCGDDNGNASASTPAPKTAAGGTATVGVANSGLGKILVDSQGRTVYLFEKDSGGKSACSGGCAAAWPPVVASGKPTVGDGATASLIGTTTRSDGQKQVTYDGHPLYTYTGDSNAGDTNGQGLNAFGALWYVLSPAGDEITTASSSSGSGNGY